MYITLGAAYKESDENSCNVMWFDGML